MQKYLYQWSDSEMDTVEQRLKSLHNILSKEVCPKLCPSSPGQVEMCGSYLTRALVYSSSVHTKAFPAVDLSATIPESFCSAKQLDAGEYLDKRAEYLTGVCAGLKEALPGSPLADASCATVYSLDGSKSYVEVTFKTTNFPIRIHARPEKVTAHLQTEKAATKKKAPYTNAVLEDAAMPHLLKLIHELCSSSPAFMRSLIMLKAWGHHCGLTAGGSSRLEATWQVPSVVFAALLFNLQASSILSASMSEGNMVRTAWVQIARGVLDNNLNILALEYPHLNFLHRSSSAFVKNVLKPAAEDALNFALVTDAFNTPALRLTSHFDAVVESKLSKAVKGEEAHTLLTQMEATLQYALSDRLVFVVCSLGSAGTSVVSFIRTVNSNDARAKLSKGPSIELSKEVQAYTDFWGAERITTRQFGDGTVHKCVWWGDSCTGFGHTAYEGIVPVTDVTLSKSDVVKVIASTALALHHGNSVSECVEPFGDLMHPLREEVGTRYIDTAPIARPQLEAASTTAKALIDSVSSKLACNVMAFEIISASTRGTEPYPLRPHAALTSAAVPAMTVVPFLEPVHCVLTIDDKNKIPDTLEAIAKMKGALSAQLSNALVAKNVESFCTVHSVDFIQDGFLFRVYIAHYREVSLLRALERHPQADSLERKLFWATQHAVYVGSCYSSVYSAFGLATRLAKRWVGAMLMGEFVGPEVIELMVARGFTSRNKPRSGFEGFARFLELAATFNWKTEALIVDPTSHAAADKKPTWDRTMQGMCILAPYDEDAKSPFTQVTPRPMIVERLAALAAQALTAFNQGRLLSLFAADTSKSFDFTLPLSQAIQLCPDRCVNKVNHMFTKPRRIWRLGELEKEDQQRYITQLAELEPAHFCLKTLRQAGRESCMVFMDIYGPTKVAVVLLASTPSHKQKANTMAALVSAAPRGSLDIAAIEPLVAPKKEVKAASAAPSAKKAEEEADTNQEKKKTTAAPKHDAKAQKKGGKRARSAATA